MRLWERREDIERAILTHIHEHFPDPVVLEDAVYAMGLRRTVSAVVEYGIGGIEQSDTESVPIPAIALAQARSAVCAEVDLATVLRCYIAGYGLFEGFVGHEAEDLGLTGPQFSSCWPHQRQVELMDHLVLEVTGSYEAERAHIGRSAERQRLERLRLLLAGESVDPKEIEYDLDGWHLALIAISTGARGLVRVLQARLGRSALVACAERDVVWAWFGSRRQSRSDELERILEETKPSDASLAVGEPGRGIEGWRLSHRQAQAALRVALYRPQPVTRYVDVMLLASALQDEVLARSLADIYLQPLGEPNSTQGAEARAMLHAYFKANDNATVAAWELRVSPKTVGRHLRAIERLVGRPLSACHTELEVALYLEELGARGHDTAGEHPVG